MLRTPILFAVRNKAVRNKTVQRVVTDWTPTRSVDDS